MRDWVSQAVPSAPHPPPIPKGKGAGEGTQPIRRTWSTNLLPGAGEGTFVDFVPILSLWGWWWCPLFHRWERCALSKMTLLLWARNGFQHRFLRQQSLNSYRTDSLKLQQRCKGHALFDAGDSWSWEPTYTAASFWKSWNCHSLRPPRSFREHWVVVRGVFKTIR